MTLLKPFDDISLFHDALPIKGALMGLDVGTKVVGTALTDVARRVAVPSAVLPRLPFSTFMVACLDFIHKHSICGLVVGYPLEMDGHAGTRCQSIYDFCLNFLGLYAIPVLLQDERLSTVASHHLLVAGRGMKGRTRARYVDSVAAMWILQTALDRLLYFQQR